MEAHAHSSERPRRPAASPDLLRVLFAAGMLASLALWYGTAENFEGGGDVVASLGRTAGLLAAYLCLVLLLLMARIPWMERAVGFDRLTAWHRTLGTSTVMLIALHAGLSVWGYSIDDDRAFFDQGWTVVSTYPGMVRGAIAGALLLVIGVTSAAWVRRQLPYETWWLLHLGAYVAVILAFTHQVEAGDQFVGRETAGQVMLAIYLGVVAAVLWWRLIVPLRDAYARRLVVAEVRPEAGQAASIVLRGDALREVDARAGQYVLLRFLTGRLWTTAHPYSLSAPPDGDTIRITVRADGDHSAATLAVEPGCRVIMEGPFGAFTADAARSGAGALLIGGGSGIVPVRGIAEILAGRGHDVVVVQRASDADGLLLGDELREAAGDGRIALHQVLGRRGELGQDPLSRAELTARVPDISTRDVWICGPTGMIETAVAGCRAADVPAAHLHIEEFAW